MLVTTGARVRHRHFPQRLAGEFSPSPHSPDLDLMESTEAHFSIDTRGEENQQNI